MFLRAYAASLSRPWLKNSESAFDDARYRLSIPLAAPFVAMMALLVLILRQIIPSILSRRAAALLICGSLIFVGVVVYVALGRFFKRYTEQPELARRLARSSSPGEATMEVFLWICVSMYCALLIFV
jgi:hypothetical protein